VVIRSRIWILDHSPLPSIIVVHGILGDLLAFLVQSLAAFNETLRTDWRRRGNESITFSQRRCGHRIPINPEISIRIVDHFWLRAWGNQSSGVTCTFGVRCTLSARKLCRDSWHLGKMLNILKFSPRTRCTHSRTLSRALPSSACQPACVSWRKPFVVLVHVKSKD